MTLHYVSISLLFPAHLALLLLFEQLSSKIKYSIKTIPSQVIVFLFLFFCHLYKRTERFKHP